MSPLLMGPKAGSYSPPAFGWLRLSNKTGFTTCLTLIRLTSSLVRYLNPTLSGCEATMSILCLLRRSEHRALAHFGDNLTSERRGHKKKS